MDIRKIEYFLHLARFGHVSATADFLNISQPSLSKHIHALEKDIGAKLFDRIGNRIVLNKNGEQFAQYAKQAMDLLNAGTSFIKSSAYDTKGTIQIAYASYAPIIASCITEYAAINPLINFQVVVLNGSTDMTYSEQLDFLLNASSHDAAPTDATKLFWVTQPLFRESYVLIYADAVDYVLSPETFQLSELKHVAFVTMAQKDVFFTDITFSLCLNAGFFPQIYCKTDDFIVKVKIVAASIAVAFIPESCLQDALSLAPNLRHIRLNDYCANRTINIMRHRKSLMTEAALDFWDFILDYYHLPQDTRD